MDSKQSLDYDETFNSVKNNKIRRKLVPELRKALAPNFCTTAEQVTKWLSCLHKSRRSQRKVKNTGKSVEGQRRVHSNSRLNDVSNNIILSFIPIYILNLV